MSDTQEKIQEKIQVEIEQARAVCDISGGNSAECAAAWDAVEELQAEASHQRNKKPKNSLPASASSTTPATPA